jgi:hypothetical protein
VYVYDLGNIVRMWRAWQVSVTMWPYGKQPHVQNTWICILRPCLLVSTC